MFYFSVPYHKDFKITLSKAVQLLLLVLAGFFDCSVWAKETPSRFIVLLFRPGVESGSIVLDGFLQSRVNKIKFEIPAFVPDVEFPGVRREVGMALKFDRKQQEDFFEEALRCQRRTATNESQTGCTIALQQCLSVFGHGVRVFHEVTDTVFLHVTFTLTFLDGWILADRPNPISLQTSLFTLLPDIRILEGAANPVVLLQSLPVLRFDFGSLHDASSKGRTHLRDAFFALCSPFAFEKAETGFSGGPSARAQKSQALIATCVRFREQRAPMGSKKRPNRLVGFFRNGCMPTRILVPLDSLDQSIGAYLVDLPTTATILYPVAAPDVLPKKRCTDCLEEDTDFRLGFRFSFHFTSPLPIGSETGVSCSYTRDRLSLSNAAAYAAFSNKEE